MPILLLVTGASLQAQEIHSLSVRDAIGYATKNNFLVKNAILDLQIQQQSNKSLTAGALPSITGAASTIAFFQTPVTIVPGEFFGGPPGSSIAVSFQPKYSAGGAINLSQVIFDGSVFVGLKARKTSIDYYQKAVDITE
jgi:outer membrane protein